MSDTAKQYAINRTLTFRNRTGDCIGKIDSTGYYKLIVQQNSATTEIEILNNEIVSIIRVATSEEKYKVVLDDNCVFINISGTYDLFVEYFSNFELDSSRSITFDGAEEYTSGIKYFPGRALVAGNSQMESTSVAKLSVGEIAVDTINLGYWKIQGADSTIKISLKEDSK